MTTWQERAARNNAEWCSAVCDLQGLSSEFSEDAWTSSSRTPPLFPDAVTLAPSVPVSGLLSLIDASSGCSIKDSFADLDLEPMGFRVLLEAQWIVKLAETNREHAPRGTWFAVGDEAALDGWNAAWGTAQGTSGGFPAPILARDDIVVAAHSDDGRISAGVVCNMSADAVGITNLWTSSGSITDAWTGCLGFVGALFPNVPLVGYEAGSALRAAETSGFEAVGPLRVWVRD